MVKSAKHGNLSHEFAKRGFLYFIVRVTSGSCYHFKVAFGIYFGATLS